MGAIFVEMGLGSVVGTFFITSYYFGDIDFFKTYFSCAKFIFLSVRPTGDLGLLYLTFSDSKPGDSPKPLEAPLFKSPKSNDPFFNAPLMAEASVLLKAGL
jgi:hypothetical protein